ELMEKLASITPVETTIPLYSTVTGERVTDRRYDAAYWCENVRNPVYFEKVIRTLIDDDYRVFIEVGPHPVLRNSIKEICADAGKEIHLCQTLNRKQQEPESFYQSVANACAEGAELQWQLRHPTGNFVKLPVYPWQREMLWRESESQRRDRQDDVERPLLGMKIPAANVWRCDLADYRLRYLENHVVDGLAIMPAAGYIEAMIECAQGISTDSGKGWRLADIVIEKALVLDSGEALNMEVTVNESGDTFTVKSFNEQRPDQVSRHASASIYPLPVIGCSKVDIQSLLAEFEKPLQASEIYGNFTKFSMQYGPLFQPIERCYLKGNNDEVISQLVLPDDPALNRHHYQMHPALLDGCLQTVLCLLNPEEGAFLPTAINEMKIYDVFPARIYCHGCIKKRNSRRVECDLSMFDEKGNVIASIKGLVCSALLSKDRHKEYPEGDLRFEWKAEELNNFTVINKKWLAIEEGNVSIFSTICTHFTRYPDVDVTISSMKEVMSGGIDTTKFDAVLYMADSGYDNDLDPAGMQASEHLLELIQVLAKSASIPRLYIVTRSAFIVDPFDTATIPAQGALAGLSRVAFNEIDNLGSTIIDLPKIVDDENIVALLKELLSNRNKDEVALRNSGRYFSELLPSGLFTEVHKKTLSAEAGDRFELIPTDNEEAFELVEQVAPEISVNEIELKIEAINLPKNMIGHQSSNNESELTGVCARVTRVGMNVSAYNAGDRVAGIIPFSLSSYIISPVDAGVLVKIDEVVPASFAASEATYIASSRRIIDKLSLPGGSTALVCENAPGQSLSSCLKKKNINVITVSANKDCWHQTLIDDLVGDKEIALLAVPVNEWDKVFGFTMLTQGGVVIDLANNDDVFTYRHGIGSMIRYNLASDLKNNKAQISEYLREAMTGDKTKFSGKSMKLAQFVQNGTPVTDTDLVLDFDDNSALLAKAADVVNIFSDAVYLVTGGFGGLGKETAKWLARNGAGHIVLCSRRAGESHDDQVFMEMLGTMGSHVTAQPCDLSDITSVQNMIGIIEKTGIPFKGIFHTAGLIEDKPVKEMTREDMRKVMLPKALGAWHLHVTTQSHKLDHFVLYSSIAVLLGNSRQANYCAANGFLDALARYRQLHNQAGMSINWGAISSVGILSQDSKIGDHLTQIGLAPLPFNLGLNGMERAISTRQVNISISSQPEWETWRGYEVNALQSSRYRTEFERARGERDDSVKSRLATKLAVLDQEVQTQVLTSLVSEIFATALKMPAEQIDPSRPLESLGVDSLLATEIRMSLDVTLGVSVSALELTGSSSIASLAHKCLDQLQLDNQEDIAA
ncbi:MAG: SDR family NAD(P)-dependent oxidoreductase, partial [Gammaproteobacteria bacterium]|nr:SDR family NAD(P)-dependent oxidoreductase [Gammaproteobacteria bacterium]